MTTATASPPATQPMELDWILSDEARTLGVDVESSVRFLRCWRLVRPGVAMVTRAFLRAVDEEVR